MGKQVFAFVLDESLAVVLVVAVVEDGVEMVIEIHFCKSLFGR